MLFSADGEEYWLEEQNASAASVLVGEVTQSGIHWAEPRDRVVQKAGPQGDRSAGIAIGCHHQFSNVLLTSGEIRAVRSGESVISLSGGKRGSFMEGRIRENP